MTTYNPNRLLQNTGDHTSVYRKKNTVDVVAMPGPAGNPGATGANGTTSYTELYTLSPTNIAERRLLLPHVPNPITSLELEVQGAPTQYYGVDFFYLGGYVRWDSLALELLLVSGDNVVVRYLAS